MFAVTAGYVIYSFVNSNVFPETMMRFTYKAVLVYTKVNRAYNKLTTYFSNMINRDKTNNNNNNDNNISSVSSTNTDSYTDYEIRIIKNGIKCEQFETMKIFKESNYLGNPNDYCDSQDEESQSQSSTNESCDVCDDVCDSQEHDDIHAGDAGDAGAIDGGNQEKITTHMTVDKNEQLFIMKHNNQNNTIRFIPYDFIMQTLFSANGENCGGSSHCNKLNKNYTRLYRQFTENDFLVSLKNTNIGNYYPTNSYVAESLDETFETMDRSDFSLIDDVVVYKLLVNNLVKASSSKLTLEGGDLRIEASSSGKSMLILPLEFSNCLAFKSNDSKSGFIDAFRVNGILTGLLFDGFLDVTAELRYGIFTNTGCRLKDLDDYKTLTNH
jgi:hypothetical protein